MNREIKEITVETTKKNVKSSVFEYPRIRKLFIALVITAFVIIGVIALVRMNFDKEIEKVDYYMVFEIFETTPELEDFIIKAYESDNKISREEFEKIKKQAKKIDKDEYARKSFANPEFHKNLQCSHCAKRFDRIDRTRQRSRMPKGLLRERKTTDKTKLIAFKKMMEKKIK